MYLKNESKLENHHEYLRVCVQVSIPIIHSPHSEIRMRTKDVAYSAVLNDRTLRTKGCETLGIEWEWYQTQENIYSGVSSGYCFMFSSLWQFITKCDRHHHKIWQLFYYKIRQKFITKCVKFFITKCDSITKRNNFIIKSATFHRCPDLFQKID